MNQDDKKIKILFLDHTPFIGGAQISLIELLTKLDRQHFEPLVGCTMKAKKLGLTARYEQAGLSYCFLAMDRLKFWHPAALVHLWNNIGELRRLLKKEEIRLIFANTIRTAIIAALAIIFSEVKVIWYLQDYTFPRPLYKLLRFIPAKILYVSRSVAGFYQKNLQAKDEVIHIWRNFYEQAGQVSEAMRDAKRREWDVESEMISVGFVGRLIEWKGRTFCYRR
jgi:glycosyltransferase involved in cell wall biosynthesis